MSNFYKNFYANYDGMKIVQNFGKNWAKILEFCFDTKQPKNYDNETKIMPNLYRNFDANLKIVHNVAKNLLPTWRRWMDRRLRNISLDMHPFVGGDIAVISPVSLTLLTSSWSSWSGDSTNVEVDIEKGAVGEELLVVGVRSTVRRGGRGRRRGGEVRRGGRRVVLSSVRGRLKGRDETGGRRHRGHVGRWRARVVWRCGVVVVMVGGPCVCKNAEKSGLVTKFRKNASAK